MRGLVWAITETNANESGQSRGGAPALAASADLSADAHHDDVDRASQQFWHAEAFFASIPGRLLLFLFSWALILHMLGGIRHLIWDTGTGLDKKSIEIFAWGTLLGSITLTILLWLVGYCIRGSL